VIRKTTGRNIHILAVQRNRKDLECITALCASGNIVPPIDQRYPLSEVPEALWYLGEGRAKGKIVITLENASKT
jgi:NADPH:quinone reductase-like Zn-dependent oxidoreductase